MHNALICTSADKARIPADAGNAKLTNTQRRKLPSYVSARSFARALIDTVIPDAAGATTMDEIRSALTRLPASHLRVSLLGLANAAAGDIVEFRRSIEEWYDDHMARVSGWYKRHVRWVSLVLGALLVLVFNLNALQVTRSLYTDQVLSASIVTEATRAAQCGIKDPATCLQDVRGQVDRVRGAGLPIGWATASACTRPMRLVGGARLGGAERHRRVRRLVVPVCAPRLGADDPDTDTWSPILVRRPVAAGQPTVDGSQAEARRSALTTIACARPQP